MYLRLVARPRHVRDAVGQRLADRVQAGDELALCAEHVQRALAHPRHHAHVDDDVGRVGQLDADVALVRAQRTHRERHDVHRAALHRTAKQLGEGGAHLRGVAPVVRRAGVLLALGADERAVLDARDIARVRAGEIAVGPLAVGQALEGPAVHEQLAERIGLLRGAVAPVDAVGLREHRRRRRPTRSGGRGRCARVLRGRSGCSWRSVAPGTGSLSRLGPVLDRRLGPFAVVLARPWSRISARNRAQAAISRSTWATPTRQEADGAAHALNKTR